MRFSPRPLASYLRHKLRPVDFFGLADRVSVLAEGDREERKPAIALPGEAAKLNGTAADTTLAVELERLDDGVYTHGATVMYTFRHAVVADGVVYRKAGQYLVNSHRRRPFIPVTPVVDEPSLLCSTFNTCRYFGHFLTDGLPMEELASRLRLNAISLQTSHWPHANAYRDMLGLRVSTPRTATFQELSVVDDRGLNRFWRERMAAIRAGIKKISISAFTGSKAVFLVRGQLGAQRTLLNETDVSNALSRIGFDVVVPEQETALALVEKLKDAEIIVAVEGSIVAHALLIGPRLSRLIVIVPSNRFISIFKPVAEALDMRWGFVVANSVNDHAFSVDLPRLLATIELAAQA